MMDHVADHSFQEEGNQKLLPRRNNSNFRDLLRIYELYEIAFIAMLFASFYLINCIYTAISVFIISSDYIREVKAGSQRTLPKLQNELIHF